MAFRFVLLCASALLVQTVCGTYILPQQQSSIQVGSQQVSEVDSYSSVQSGLGYGAGINSGLAYGSAGINNGLAYGSAGINNGLAYGAGINNGLAYGAGINNGLAYGSAGINNAALLSAGNLGINNLGLSSGLASNVEYISGPSSVLVQQQPSLVVAQQPAVLVAQQQPALFNVVSGSPSYDVPCGVTVSSENQLSGLLDVVGTLPFYASTWFEGSVPSSGEAGLAFVAGNGAGLAETGCGVGLGGANGIALQGVLGQTLAANPAQGQSNSGGFFSGLW